MAMVYVYFVYGFAFVATGLVLGLQARLPISVLGRQDIRLLSSFALVHGMTEWMAMWQLVHQADDSQQWLMQVATPTVNALSFGLLFQFGVGLLWMGFTTTPRWLRPTLATLTLA